MDFLKVDRYADGYEYILVIADHFPHYAKAYATRNKSVRRQQRNYWMILSFDLKYFTEYSRAKEESLKIVYLKNYTSTYELKTFGLPHTMLCVIAWLKEWIQHFSEAATQRCS